MKISHWMLAIALTATAWAPASAKLSVGTITPVKPEKAAKTAHREKAPAHHAATKKAEAVHVASKKAPAAQTAGHKAVESKTAHPKPVESKTVGKKDLLAKSKANQSAANQSAAKKDAGKTSAATEKKNAAADASTPRLERKNNRDPFVSPIIERVPGRAKCAGTGRQCLFVGDVQLQGVVESSGSYIAVVASGIHTYFLRDNDPLADGEVERITRNAIILRQRSSDALGRPVVREVTKKLGGPPA
jgi:membrane protein involved in colicin uptake